LRVVDDGHEVELDLGMDLVEPSHHGGGRGAVAHDVQAQRAPAGPHGVRGPLLDPQ
jgi:hypothetical protein